MRRGLTYIGFAYLLSWLWWLPLALTGAISRPGQAWPTHLPGFLGPALAAVITTLKFDGRSGLLSLWSRITRWRVPWPWYVLIVATAILAALASLADTDGSAGAFTMYPGAGRWGWFAVLSVLLLNGFGVEIGWRGFLVEAMMQGHSLIDASVRIWIVWGVWQLPLLFIVQAYREMSVVGILMWATGLLASSVWLAWMYTEGMGSVLLVAVWQTEFMFATTPRPGSGLSIALATGLLIVAGLVIASRRSSHLGPEAR